MARFQMAQCQRGFPTALPVHLYDNNSGLNTQNFAIFIMFCPCNSNVLIHSAYMCNVFSLNYFGSMLICSSLNICISMLFYVWSSNPPPVLHTTCRRGLQKGPTVDDSSKEAERFQTGHFNSSMSSNRISPQIHTASRYNFHENTHHKCSQNHWYHSDPTEKKGRLHH